MKESGYNVWVERSDYYYVFNCISGGLLRVPKNDYLNFKDFIAGKHCNCSPRLLEQLALGRMLIPSDSDEIDLLRQIYEASRYDSSHFALTIVTSLGCNFDCPYCFEAKHPSIMNQEIQQQVIDLLRYQLTKIKSFHVTWFGGEPLVGKEPLLALSDTFIELCDSAGVTYSSDIVTNGYLLDEPTCLQLKERRIQSVQVCLDGPPEIHDKMRPLMDGKGSFWGIIKNLHSAIKHLNVGVRMNVDENNFGHAEDLLRILQREGFSGKLTVSIGQIVKIDDGIQSPSTSYKNCCFTNSEFAKAQVQFVSLASSYGFHTPSLPTAVETPCTAVRANELVIGSNGELYKCWESVGNVLEIIGHISDYMRPNTRLQKWLRYDPFKDKECRSCIALPVCMGGCAHHAMNPMLYENRCSTFRHAHQEEILDFVEYAEKIDSPTMFFVGSKVRKMDTR